MYKVVVVSANAEDIPITIIVQIVKTGTRAILFSAFNFLFGKIARTII
jgi:hypothetical protein